MHHFNFRMVAALLGTLFMLVSGLMLTGVIWCFVYDEPWMPITLSAGITFLLGVFLRALNYRGNTRRENDVRKRDGFLIVTFGWLFMSVVGSLPFLLSGTIPHPVDAFFETMSGFTTTGATILTDIESMPRNLLYWRSLTHWIGGMGIIVLTVAILPLLGIGGMQLFVAEAPGVSPDKLHPRITETAKRLWIIYFILTLAQTTFLRIGGMSFFDAINHAFATMATGGFSTRNASIAAFNSPFIEYTIILFMFLAGINFTLMYLGFSGKPKQLLRNEEFRVYSLIILLSGIAISLGLYLSTSIPLESAIRNGFFQVVSIVTTTGFITDDYELWPTFLLFGIFILFFAGGSAGSTAGGIKVMRHIVLIRNSVLELKRQLHPSAIIPVRYNGKAVPQHITYTIAAFVLIYLIIFFLGSLVMALIGLDFESAMGATIATLGNIGPGIGTVGAVDNFAHIPYAGKAFLSFLMLLGRLELFTVLILFMPHFWRNR